MHARYHSQPVHKQFESALGHAGVSNSEIVIRLHIYEDYGTNLRLLTNFGGLKVPQLERHTESTCGIHWRKGKVILFNKVALLCTDRGKKILSTVRFR